MGEGREGRGRGGGWQRHALTPTVHAGGIARPYREDLEFVFSADEIHNVAVSGPYGAGKSSLMQTWQRADTQREGRYVHVSVLCLHGDAPGTDVPAQEGAGQDARQEATSENRAREIEARLINQLVHRLDHNKTPKSRFHHTQDDVGRAPTLVALALGALYALGQGLGYLFGKNDELGDLEAAVAVAAIAIGAVIVYNLVMGMANRDLHRRLLRGLKFVNVEAEITDGNADTLFDRYLDDIIYLLDSSDVEVVVFEDLDRYESLAPFEDLREICELTNVARKRRGAKALRFFYLVRDSLFPDPLDRVKFFDYVIPVLPFVDANNAYALFGQNVGKGGSLSGETEAGEGCVGAAAKGDGAPMEEDWDVRVSDSLLHRISAFVNDPRLVYDLANEAHTQKGALGGLAIHSKGWSDDRLMAVVSYRVLFPEDYEELVCQRGYVRALFEGDTRAVRGRVERIEDRLRMLRRQIDTNRDERILGFLRRLEHADESGLTSTEGVLREDMVAFAEGKGREWPDLGTGEADASAVLESLREDGSMSSHVDAMRLEAYPDVRDVVDSDAMRMLREQERRLADERRSVLGELSRPFRDRSTGDRDEFLLSEGALESPSLCNPQSVDRVVASPYFPLLRDLLLNGELDESYPLYTSRVLPGDLAVDDRAFVLGLRRGKLGSADGAGVRPVSGQAQEGDVVSFSSREMADSAAAVLLQLEPNHLRRSGAPRFALVNELLDRGPDDKLQALVEGMASRRDRSDALFLACYADPEISGEDFGRIDRLLGKHAEELAGLVQMALTMRTPLPLELDGRTIDDDGLSHLRRILSHRFLIANQGRLGDGAVREALDGIESFAASDSFWRTNVRDGGVRYLEPCGSYKEEDCDVLADELSRLWKDLYYARDGAGQVAFPLDGSQIGSLMKEDGMLPGRSLDTSCAKPS